MTSAYFRAAIAAAALITAIHLAGSAAAHGPGNHKDTRQGATATDGQPGKPEEVTRTIRVDAQDDTFSVKQITVRAGETIRFIITNRGYEPHEFSIASAKEQEEHREMMRQSPNMVHEDPNVVTVQAAGTKELIWKFGKDTDVTFACNIPGHTERGMHGTFRILQGAGR